MTSLLCCSAFFYGLPRFGYHLYLGSRVHFFSVWTVDSLSFWYELQVLWCLHSCPKSYNAWHKYHLCLCVGGGCRCVVGAGFCEVTFGSRPRACKQTQMPNIRRVHTCSFTTLSCPQLKSGLNLLGLRSHLLTLIPFFISLIPFHPFPLSGLIIFFLLFTTFVKHCLSFCVSVL